MKKLPAMWSSTKLLLIGLLFTGACRSRTVEAPAPARAPAPTAASAGSSLAGASTPRLAVEAFLGAVRSGDLQAMSRIWGDKDGPVRDRKVMSMEEAEKREIYLIKCLRHDSHRMLAESPAAGGERIVNVELMQGTTRYVTDFFTTKGGDRWYVRSATLDPKRCSAK